MRKIRFAILDQFSGRSSGCHAALDMMLKEIKEIYPSAYYDLYTVLFPKMERFFPTHLKYLRKVSMNPWWGSINFLGLPTLINFLKADVIIFRGGHLFDKNLYNPFYSYLLNFFFVIPYAKLLKKPVATYSIGVGPFNTQTGKIMFKKVLNNIDLIVVRESGSARIIHQMGRDADAVLADPVYNLKASENIDELIHQAGLSIHKQYLGLNATAVTNLMDIRRNVSKDNLVNSVVNIIDALYQKNNIETILFPTDTEYQIYKEIRSKTRVPIHYADREKNSPRDLAALMSICKCFVGMRMHSLILSLSQYVPTIGIVYSEKVKYILQDSNMHDRIFQLSDIIANSEILYAKIVSIFDNYEAEYEFTKANVIPMQEKAKQMPDILKNFLDKYWG